MSSENIETGGEGEGNNVLDEPMPCDSMLGRQNRGVGDSVYVGGGGDGDSVSVGVGGGGVSVGVGGVSVGGGGDGVSVIIHLIKYNTDLTHVYIRWNFGKDILKSYWIIAFYNVMVGRSLIYL